MKKTLYTIFLILFLIGNYSIAQTLEGKVTLSSDSYFELNNEEIENFKNKAVVAYENEEFQQAGFLFVEAFKYSAGTDNNLLSNGLTSFVSARDVDNSNACYDKLLEGAINSLKKKTQFSLHRNMAILYESHDNFEKFVKAIDLARTLDKDEVDLLLMKANYYFEKGDTPNFIVTLEQAHHIDSKHFTVNYNLGYLYYDGGDFDKAKYHYKKALKADKKSEAANMNYAVLLLSQENDIINEMNNLGHSKSDLKKYDSLKKERERIHKSVIPYLEKVLKINNKNAEVIRTLTAIYEGLGYDKKIEKLQKQTS